MPRDTQIHPTGTVAAPADYVVPASAELLLKMVYAKFDGSGAAGSFKPCLRIISDAGSVAGEAVADETVAAGGSADVTWFPRVGAAAQGAAASTGVQWFFASRVTNQNVASANLNRISWTHHVTSDSSVFTVQSHILANDQVIGNKAGVYIAAGSLNWAAPQNYKHYATINTDFFGVSALGQSPVSDSAADQTEATRSRLVGDSIICITQSVPGEISLFAGNNDAVTHAVTLATFAIAYLPNSTLVT